MAAGQVERIALGGSVLKHRVYATGFAVEKAFDCPDHNVALGEVLRTLTAGPGAVIGEPGEITAVAHRVVHGGESLNKSVVINHEVMKILRDNISLAPLHNPPNIAGIEAAQAVLPNATHVAVFDTAFHYKIPDYAYLYAVPYEWYLEFGIRRYGFHGTSHLYVSRRAAALLGKEPAEVNVITLHIGNGASACAVRGGFSVDTSMGFTPLEGLVMGTRAGDLDPAIFFHMTRAMPLLPEQVYSALNRHSGILGITGKYADRRDVLGHYHPDASRADADALEPGSPYRCRLALEVECYRLKKYIGAYAAVLGRVDALVFTAGVGENCPEVRARATAGLDRFGIILDAEKNARAVRGEEEDIAAAASPTRIFVIPTDEERVFIEDTVALLEGRYAPPDQFVYSFQKPGYMRKRF